MTVGTVSSAILSRYGKGELVANLRHLRPSIPLLRRLESQEFAAAIMELPRFDWYRNRHTDTALRWSGYVHSIGFNMAFAVLQRQAALRQRVDDVLGKLLDNGTIKALAAEAAVTYVQPKKPLVLTRITPAMLAGD